MISRERLEKALTYLAETDEMVANAKAELERAEIVRKRVRSRIYLTTDGTVAERQSQSEVHFESADSDERYVTAVAAYEGLKAKRQTEALIVDVWRSLESSRRQGNVT